MLVEGGEERWVEGSPAPGVVTVEVSPSLIFALVTERRFWRRVEGRWELARFVVAAVMPRAK